MFVCVLAKGERICVCEREGDCVGVSERVCVLNRAERLCVSEREYEQEERVYENERRKSVCEGETKYDCE